MAPTEELQNENPAFIISIYVYNILANYGWFLLIAAIACVYFYNKVCRTYLENYWKRKSEDEYAAKYHKNPDVLQNTIFAMEKAREKMQERCNIDIEQFKVKQQMKEERKRQEFLEKHGANLKGNKLGYGTKVEGDEKKKSLRADYNPLMGSSSGSSYRAPKKSCCGGGGCG